MRSWLILWAMMTVPTLALEPIPRRVPPVGLEIPVARAKVVRTRLAELRSSLNEMDHPCKADVAVLLKAVRMAVDQRECYREQDLDLLDQTLDLAANRLQSLRQSKTPWTKDRLTVRGFYSRIDQSPQPYGLVLPEQVSQATPLPLYVWLHGRGDKTTDLHFIAGRLKKAGQFAPPGAIVLHPFGRQCLGFKSAGETDVLEAIEAVQAEYPVDPQRIVLAGFSMGGAGAWHLGAHFADRFVAVSPGAGFAETAQYNRLTSAQIEAIPWYERKLWGQYDVPAYVRNLFNLPVVAYSGELDKQIQAARVMEAAFAEQGRQLSHVIGPKMGHKYDPESLKRIQATLARSVAAGRAAAPRVVHLQTRTLRYARLHWVEINQLQTHWEPAQVLAERFPSWIRVNTSPSGSPSFSNVRRLTLHDIPAGISRIVIDGQSIDTAGGGTVHLARGDERSASSAEAAHGEWKPVASAHPDRLAKTPGRQGPIDDAFVDRFLVVTPDGAARTPAMEAWTQFELDHLRSRWSALFRGTLPEKLASDVTREDMRDAHVVLFGDPQSNSLLRKVLPQLPLEWSEGQLRLGDQTFSEPSQVPLMVYPNPLAPQKYVVLNSGPTFRESHDRTNSLQNPKLPDWAILDITAPPGGEFAGRVADAGFFDEFWQPATRKTP